MCVLDDWFRACLETGEFSPRGFICRSPDNGRRLADEVNARRTRCILRCIHFNHGVGELDRSENKVISYHFTSEAEGQMTPLS